MLLHLGHCQDLTPLSCMWQFHVSCIYWSNPHTPTLLVTVSCQLHGPVKHSHSCHACDNFLSAVWTGQTLTVLSCMWQFNVGCIDWSNPHSAVMLVTVSCQLYGPVKPSHSCHACDNFLSAVWTGKTLTVLSCMSQFNVGCIYWSNLHTPALLVTVSCRLYGLV